jgi:transposase
MDRQTLRDWAHRFNALGPAGLKDNRRRGNPRRLSAAQQAELAGIVGTGPDPAVDGAVRWRRIDLQRVIEERFGIAYHERSIGKLLRALGFSHISASQRHPKQDGQVVQAKKLPAHACGPSRGRDPQEEDRDLVPGRGEDRPEEGPRAAMGAPRHAAAPARRPALRECLPVRRHLPSRGTGAALALPFADTDAMQRHLDETSQHVARNAHAVLLLDRAGWHTTGNLIWPKNITPILLPSRSPELNPFEQVWLYLRANYLSNRVFDDYNAIIDAACEAWRNLLAQPHTITSIGMRTWGA